MINDWNTWLITSTINVTAITDGEFEINRHTSESRYQQTLETIASIRRHDPTGKIAMVDNSNKALTRSQSVVFRDLCDEFIQYEHNLFTRFVNDTFYFKKGLTEMINTEVLINTIQRKNMVGRRIFKMAGRYTLNDDFDIRAYDDTSFHGKYAYRITPWWFEKDGSIAWKHFCELKLWSFCGSLIHDYQLAMPEIWQRMVIQDEPHEEAHYNVLHAKSVIELATLGVEGYYANGTFVRL